MHTDLADAVANEEHFTSSGSESLALVAFDGTSEAEHLVPALIFKKRENATGGS